MARKPRIHFNNAVYHVILKGLDGQAVFKSVADRREWESLVEEGCRRFGHKILAYCWMKDHVQMALQVADSPLSKIMQNLSFRYTRYFNKQHDQEGPLFHGRYKAILVNPDEYQNDLIRYIHNNPVRNGVANAPQDYKWSSYHVYLGGKAQAENVWWLATDTVLRSFGKNPRAAVAAFRKFTEAGKNDGERLDLMRGSEGGRLLGDAKFARKALKPAKPVVKPTTLNQLVKVVCKEQGIKEAALKNESRARHESQIRQTITYLAMELDVASLTALANRFNRDLTTMSRNQRYFRDRLTDDKELQKHVKRLRRLVVSA